MDALTTERLVHKLHMDKNLVAMQHVIENTWP